jgi:hypothetical protein
MACGSGQLDTFADAETGPLGTPGPAFPAPTDDAPLDDTNGTPPPLAPFEGPTATGGTEAEVFEPCHFVDPLVCSSFEGVPLLDEWVVDTARGTVQEVTTLAHTGTTAVSARTAGENGHARLWQALEPRGSGTLYFRAHAWLPKGTVTTMMKLLYLGNRAALDGVDLLITSDLQVGAFFQEGQASALSRIGAVPEEQWFCLTGSIDLSNTDGRVALQIDGRPVLEVTGQDTLPPNGVSGLSVGLHWTDTGQEETQL